MVDFKFKIVNQIDPNKFKGFDFSVNANANSIQKIKEAINKERLELGKYKIVGYKRFNNNEEINPKFFSHFFYHTKNNKTEKIYINKITTAKAIKHELNKNYINVIVGYKYFNDEYDKINTGEYTQLYLRSSIKKNQLDDMARAQKEKEEAQAAAEAARLQREKEEA